MITICRTRLSTCLVFSLAIVFVLWRAKSITEIREAYTWREVREEPRKLSTPPPPPPVQTPPFVYADIRIFDGMTCEDDCNRQGYCFLRKCICFPGFSGETCDIPWLEPVPKCTDRDDSCYVTDAGVYLITEERWKRAQDAEQKLWKGNKDTNDRAQEHVVSFGGYRDVPKDLGDMIEIGCGPWTQTKFMLESDRTKAWNLTSIILWEPGIDFYRKNTPTCTYKDGKFLNYSTTLVSEGAEKLNAHHLIDTLYIANVMEHVQDALGILVRIYRAMKPGALLIFSERSWDRYGFDKHGVGTGNFMELDRLYHPIRMKSVILDHFLSHFNTIYVNRNAEGNRLRDESGVYFIGRKK